MLLVNQRHRAGAQLPSQTPHPPGTPEPVEPVHIAEVLPGQALGALVDALDRESRVGVAQKAVVESAEESGGVAEGEGPGVPVGAALEEETEVVLPDTNLGSEHRSAASGEAFEIREQCVLEEGEEGTLDRWKRKKSLESWWALLAK
jgi:hypothetical protein